MSSMFQDCTMIKKLNLENFNTSNVSDMNSMFKGCKSLSELDLTYFDKRNVRNQKQMFSGCSNELQKKIKNENKNIHI